MKVMQSLMNPEAILFGNPIAQMACAVDCFKSSFFMPIDALFWCAGCSGNMYPLSGDNGSHTNVIRSGLLLATRMINKLHRLGLAEETSTTECKFNGKLCAPTRKHWIKKSQYKLQMTFPHIANDDEGCIPLGMTDIKYSSNKEVPYRDFGYLLWRKKNCCL
jgi:conjugal transfer pilus assembly protein TraU